MPRTGRRSGDLDTRQTILEAARTAFARDGFQATIRSIAADAGVDPALVLHYFETKDKLYLASIELSLDPDAVLDAIRAGNHEELGVRLARMFFAVWDQPELRQPILAILRGALSGHTEGTAAFREFISSTLVPVLAGQMAGPEAELRSELAAAQLVGIAVMRYVMELEPVASASTDELVRIVGERIQSYFD